MDDSQWWALVGGLLVALAVRLSNMIIEFLARILKVTPPDPIPTGPNLVEPIDHVGKPVIQSKSEATDPSE